MAFGHVQDLSIQLIDLMHFHQNVAHVVNIKSGNFCVLYILGNTNVFLKMDTILIFFSFTADHDILVSALSIYGIASMIKPHIVYVEDKTSREWSCQVRNLLNLKVLKLY